MKEIITISIEKDLVDKLPPSPGRSAFVESAIRTALKREESGNMTNIRVKNIARIFELIEEHRYAQKAHLMKLSMLELGITEKTFVRYTELLSYNKRIIDQNGWLVSLSYSGPMPWSEEGIRMRAKKRMETNVKEVEKNEEEVDDILNAEVSSDVRE